MFFFVILAPSGQYSCSEHDQDRRYLVSHDNPLFKCFIYCNNRNNFVNYYKMHLLQHYDDKLRHILSYDFRCGPTLWRTDFANHKASLIASANHGLFTSLRQWKSLFLNGAVLRQLDFTFYNKLYTFTAYSRSPPSYYI